MEGLQKWHPVCECFCHWGSTWGGTWHGPGVHTNFGQPNTQSAKAVVIVAITGQGRKFAKRGTLSVSMCLPLGAAHGLEPGMVHASTLSSKRPQAGGIVAIMGQCRRVAKGAPYM